MPIPSSLLQLPPLCAALGVQFVVTSPGSRSAALTVAFSSFPDLTTLSVRDERVAGYVALGLAQMSNKPVVLVCTSGTAALNLAPAIAEAYFLHIPLLVLTADRPPEWIHQYDGQTIFQDKLFGAHVKKSIQWLPEDSDAQAWFVRRTFSEFVWLAQQAPAGPVHINVPIREPFYPQSTDYPLKFPSSQPIVGIPSNTMLPTETISQWLDQLWQSERPLWVVGQQQSPTFSKAAHELAHHMPVVADSIGQVSPDPVLCFQDAWASHLPKDLAPDFLISSDKSILSKSLKLYLRDHKAPYHVHIQNSPEWVDPFQSLSQWMRVDPLGIVEAILTKIASEGAPQSWLAYRSEFGKREKRVKDFFFETVLLPSDASVVRTLLHQIPSKCILHGGNSMAIRYINLFYGLSQGPRVFSNRGTSGIDGCLSTAVGAAWASPDQQHVALVGDVTFWYDSNALWHNALPQNLKIILLNNQGGNIFHMIPGPMDQPGFSTYFQTQQEITAAGLAESLHFNHKSTSVAELQARDWQEFWEDPGFLVWEIKTNPDENKRVMQHWRTDLAAFF